MAVVARQRALWLPPLLLFASVVLLGSLAFAIANLDRGGETLPAVPTLGGGDSGGSPFAPAGQLFQTLWQILIGGILIGGIAAAIYARWTRQKVLSMWELLGYAFGIAVIAGLWLFFPAIVENLESLVVPGGQSQPPAAGGIGSLNDIPRSTAYPIAAVVFVIILGAVYVFSFSARVFPHLADALKGREPARARRRLEAAKAVRQTLLDLEAGTDFRTAVVACYQRMCSLIATRGILRQETLTAREIEGLALAELGLSETSVDDLTGLFEEARYSAHEIGPGERDHAVECLTAIRRELEG